MTLQTKISKDMIQLAVEHGACWTPTKLRAIEGRAIGSLLDNADFVFFVIWQLAADRVFKVPGKHQHRCWDPNCGCVYADYVAALPRSAQVKVMRKLLSGVEIVDVKD